MKKIISPIILSLILIFIVFSIHYFFPNMINNDEKISIGKDRVSNESLGKIIELHKNHAVFARRPLTTSLILALKSILGIGYAYGFILVNFIALYVCSILIYFSSLEYNCSRKEGLISMIVFYLSFSILFAFFPSIYSYDEPLQYLFILLSILLLKKQKFILFLMFLFFSYLSKESSLFLYPSILLFLIPGKNESGHKYFEKSYIKKVILSLIPLVLYMLFELIHLRNINLLVSSKEYLLQTNITHFKYNFQNIQFAIESIVSIFLSMGLQFLIVYYYLEYNDIKNDDLPIIYSSLLIFVINTPIVLMAAKARETRLFTLPLIVLWPILGKYLLKIISLIKINEIYHIIKNKKFIIFNLINILSLLTLIFISYLFVKDVYEPTDVSFAVGFKIYLLLEIFLILLYVFLIKMRKLQLKINLNFQKKRGDPKTQPGF